MERSPLQMRIVPDGQRVVQSSRQSVVQQLDFHGHIETLGICLSLCIALAFDGYFSESGFLRVFFHFPFYFME